MCDFGKKTSAEKSQAQEDFQPMTADYHAQQQVMKEQFIVEQAKKPKIRILKCIPKPNVVLYERNKNSTGGDPLF